MSRKFQIPLSAKKLKLDNIFSQLMLMGGILVFWESWQNHVVNCEEMKLCKIFGLNVKLKNDESKFLQKNDSKVGGKGSEIWQMWSTIVTDGFN